VGEVRVRRNIRLAPKVGDPLEHDQRVVRTAAQRLRPGEQEHQILIVAAAFLDRPPGQIVKRLVITSSSGRLGLDTAVGRVRAGRDGSGLEQENESEKERHWEL
jgi:hypothetical protein